MRVRSASSRVDEADVLDECRGEADAVAGDEGEVLERERSLADERADGDGVGEAHAELDEELAASLADSAVARAVKESCGRMVTAKS